jgi:hypothetical protein
MVTSICSALSRHGQSRHLHPFWRDGFLSVSRNVDDGPERAQPRTGKHVQGAPDAVADIGIAEHSAWGAFYLSREPFGIAPADDQGPVDPLRWKLAIAPYHDSCRHHASAFNSSKNPLVAKCGCDRVSLRRVFSIVDASGRRVVRNA